MTSEQEDATSNRPSSLRRAREILGDLGKQSNGRARVEVALERLLDEKELLDEENVSLHRENDELEKEHIAAEAIRGQSRTAVALSLQLVPLLGGFPVLRSIATARTGDSIYTYAYEGFTFTLKPADPMLLLDGPAYQLKQQQYALDPSLGLLRGEWLELRMVIEAARDPKLRDQMPPHVRSAVFDEGPAAPEPAQPSAYGAGELTTWQKPINTVNTDKV